MLAANITMKNIDYAKTLENAFPLLKKLLNQANSERMTIRLFQKLGDTALPILIDVVNRLPESTKVELMVQILNSYAGSVRNMLNEKLSGHSVGKNLQIGEVYVFKWNEALCLWLGRIQADYKAIVKENLSGALGFFGGLAEALLGDKLEQTALNLLWTEENKQNLLVMAKDVLNQNGIPAELDDISLMKDPSDGVSDDHAMEAENQLHLQLTDEMEEQILDALAGYLKDKAH